MRKAGLEPANLDHRPATAFSFPGRSSSVFKLAGTCLEYPGPLSDACFPLHYSRIRLRFDYTAFSAVRLKNKMPFLTVPSGFEPESRARQGARPRRWTTEQYRRMAAAGIFEMVDSEGLEPPTTSV